METGRIGAGGSETMKFANLRGEVKLQEPMSGHTSYRIGGVADALVSPVDRQDLAALLQEIRDQRLPFLVLGGRDQSPGPGRRIPRCGHQPEKDGGDRDLPRIPLPGGIIRGDPCRSRGDAGPAAELLGGARTDGARVRHGHPRDGGRRRVHERRHRTGRDGRYHRHGHPGRSRRGN